MKEVEISYTYYNLTKDGPYMGGLDPINPLTWA